MMNTIALFAGVTILAWMFFLATGWHGGRNVRNGASFELPT